MQAHVVPKSDGELCYRGVETITDIQVEFSRKNIITLKSALDYAFKKHAQNNALGTRKLLGESDEEQKNGKIFKKVSSACCLIELSVMLVCGSSPSYFSWCC